MVLEVRGRDSALLMAAGGKTWFNSGDTIDTPISAIERLYPGFKDVVKDTNLYEAFQRSLQR